MVTNQFWAIFANVKIDHLHSSLWYSETKCNIIVQMHALIAPLIAVNREKNGENRFSISSVIAG